MIIWQYLEDVAKNGTESGSSNGAGNGKSDIMLCTKKL